MDGVDLREPAYEDWLDETRRRLDARIGAVARQLGENAGAARDWLGLELAARHLLNGAPYDEEALRWRMRALAGQGRRASALEAFDAFAARLKQDLDIAPDAETAELRAELSGATSGAPASVGAPAASQQAAMRRPAVLFLPFEALSRSDDDALLAMGLCEDIRTRLACWRWFPVIGPEALGGASGDIQSLAAGVKASYAVTGTVRRAGARVVARLIDAGNPAQSQFYQHGCDPVRSDDVPRLVG